MIELLSGAFYLAALAYGYGFLSSALHLILSGVRGLRAQNSQFDWLVAGRSLVVLLGLPALAIVYGLAAMLAKFGGLVGLEPNPAAVEANVSIVAIAAGAFLFLFLPVLLPIVEVLTRRQRASVLLALASVLSLPLVAAGLIAVLLFAQSAVGHLAETSRAVRVDLEYEEIPGILGVDAYVVRKQWMPSAISEVMGVQPARSSLWTVSEFVQHRNALWLETVLDRVSFGLVTRRWGQLSALDFDREHPQVDFIVRAFEAMFSIGLVGCVGLMLRRR